MFDNLHELYDRDRIIKNPFLLDIEALLKPIKIPTALEQYGLDPFTMEQSRRLIEESRIPAQIRAINSQIESPLQNLQKSQKSLQSNLIPYGISRGLISQIESQLKNSRENSYSRYSSGANGNYHRNRVTSSTQNNDYQSHEQNYSQATSKSQNKKQNYSQAPENLQQNKKTNNIRCNAKLQFKILEEINLHVISNNNNPVEWSPSKWFGHGEGRRITNAQQSSYKNALTKLISKGLITQKKPDRQFTKNTGNAPTFVSLTKEGSLELK